VTPDRRFCPDVRAAPTAVVFLPIVWIRGHLSVISGGTPAGMPGTFDHFPKTPIGFEAMKVGEMAQRTGLAVRTLHHDEVIGRLRPSLHTQAGYRLYTTADAAWTTSDLSAGCCRGWSEGVS
jgi:hypothetical protein